MSPDYETEYNNRARVPEHPGIIAGWQADAAAYLVQASRSRLRATPTEAPFYKDGTARKKLA